MPSKFIQFVDLNMRGSCSPYANNVAACCSLKKHATMLMVMKNISLHCCYLVFQLYLLKY